MENLKYGVVVYHDTNNIGDDIQSYAAAQLLPQVDYYIEREHLDVFRPNEEGPVNVIMNGWFMHNKLAWPISSYINPLYISMHFSVNDPLNIHDLFLKGVGGKDLKSHEPIGCRDLETKSFLESNGFQTWFSGCITLTLNSITKKKVQPYICLTNVSDSVEEYIHVHYPDIDYRVISQDEVSLINHTSSWEDRFENVRKLLEVYQNATAVVTTRLHCAMPCLAMHTPVLLLYDDDLEEKGRLDGLISLTHHSSVSDYLDGKVDFDLKAPPQNPDAYLVLRQGILDKVHEFLSTYQESTPELQARIACYDTEWEQRALWKDDIVLQLQKRAVEHWRKENAALNEMVAARDWFRDLYKEQQRENQSIYEQLGKLQQENESLRHVKGWLKYKFRTLRKSK